MQLYTGQTTSRSNKRNVASFHLSTIESNVPSVFVCSSLSCCCDLHVHDYFSEWYQFSSTWFSRTLLMCCSVVFRRFLGSAHKLCSVLNCIDPHCVGQRQFSLGDAPDTHGPPFSPCSGPPRSLARSCHFAFDSTAPLSASVTSTGPTVLLMF